MTSYAASIDRWVPEDPAFWASTGERVARRTLWVTTGALTLSFATWFMWSAIVVKLPAVGFSLSVGQLFWLVSLPGLVGATLRIPYSFLVQVFGTRRVVTLATASLAIPSIGVGLAVQRPDTPYWALLLLAATAGFGGGNFSAFMPSTSLFFPKAKQGTALGLQAGIGNFGVSLVQLSTPAVIGASLFGAIGGAPQTVTKGAATSTLWLQNAAFLWVVPVVILTICAAVYLRSIPVTANIKEQSVIFRRKHTWLMTLLYIMTFGTFSGFSASFALLIKQLFGALPDAPDPLKYAFYGALIGSITRPVGGLLSDKIGGAKVTMASGVLLLGASLAITKLTAPTTAADFYPFFTAMLVIFFASGIGNGSTFRMIPVIFPPKEAAPVLGWTGAIAAYGSFVVPMLFGKSIASLGSPNAAFLGFAAFYALCLALCYFFYTREGAEIKC